MNLQQGEVCEAKLVTFEELLEMVGEGLTVPGAMERCQLYRKDLQQMIRAK